MTIIEDSIKPSEEKFPNMTIGEVSTTEVLAAGTSTDLKFNSIHIKEERLSIPNKLSSEINLQIEMNSYLNRGKITLLKFF